MEEREFLALSSLFDSIGIIEKGIERIYHFLLENKRIDNLKDVCEQFGLTLKRGYKICAVLSELSLVQIYDRPMKIHLANPPELIWQTIVNNRIDELSKQFQEKKDIAEKALSDFISRYRLDETPTQEFVEFINYDLNNFSETYYSFMAEKDCKIALGIRYENDLISIIKKHGFKDISENLQKSLSNGMLKLKDNLININIQVVFNAELIRELLESNEFNLLSKHVDSFNLEFKTIEAHVTYDDFSNFNLTDNELIQPSFDPTNKLIGAYISRNSNIYRIFEDKFNELYEKGISLNDFLSENDDINVKTLSEAEVFALCLL
jgi:hypothetical protein